MSNLKLSQFRKSCESFHEKDRGVARDFIGKSKILNELSKRKTFWKHFSKIEKILNSTEDRVIEQKQTEKK